MKELVFDVEQKTNLDATYEYIGRLAKGLYDQQLKMRVETLRQILISEDLYEYAEGRGIYNGLRGAYNHWMQYAKDNKINSDVADAIANVFVMDDGSWAWE